MSNKFTQPVIAIAENAGNAIMEIYQMKHAQIGLKTDQSPLTLADTAANKIIENGLKRLTPEWPILSEESTIPDYKERQGWQYYWLVDPLDGTKEFISKNGEFTVNIALIEYGQPILGVVFAPAIDQCYFASKGEGAFLKTKDQTRAIQSRKELSSPPVIAVSRSHIDKETQALLNKIQAPQVLNMGSSLKLCLVAEGRVDCYPRLAPTMEWDTAAAHAILNEAGGCIIDTHGNPLFYNKECLINPNFIATEKSNSAYWTAVYRQ